MKVADFMSPVERRKVKRANSVKNGIGFVLAWVWMVVCGIEVTLFAIQFNVSGTQANASRLWTVTFSLATTWDLLVVQLVKAAGKVLALRFCINFS